MQRARAMLILGLWVAALPYLGFPYLWKNILISASGLALAYMSYLAYRAIKDSEKKNDDKIAPDNFSENSL